MRLSFTPSARRVSRHLAGAGLVVLAAATLGGCAAFNQVAVDVTSFGTWPTGRPAGRFTLDRLPSQQAASTLASQQAVEQAAISALEAVGFQRVERVEEADVLVRLGARWGQVVDPRLQFGVGIGIGMGRSSGRVNAGVGYRDDPFRRFPIGVPTPSERREVDLVLTDRRSQQVLYEAHARLDGHVVAESLLAPMFEAMLQGFPQWPTGERRLVMPLSDR